MNLLRLVPHLHSWGDIKTNRYYIVIEQRCRICRLYRHHLYADRFGPQAKPGKWRKGKHPGNKS